MYILSLFLNHHILYTLSFHHMCLLYTHYRHIVDNLQYSFFALYRYNLNKCVSNYNLFRHMIYICTMLRKQNYIM